MFHHDYSYSESIQMKEMKGGFPYKSWVSLDVDPATKAAVIQMASAKDVYNPNIPFLQDEVDAMTRKKRQANYPKDCSSRQAECQSILKAVKEMTHSMVNSLEEIKNKLITQNILSANDPRDINYQKIFDCLKCKNIIEHKQEDVANYYNQRHISDVLPYFDNQYQSEDDGEEQINSKEELYKGDERTERGISKQVMESVTNSSKVSGGAKITEILHNTTIVEKDQEGESHVTRNMGGATPLVMPTADTTMIYNQQNPFGSPGDKLNYPEGINNNNPNIPPALQPFILPTAETTKYSQQIQITPQANNPSFIPICFYNNPPSGTPQQQQPFFTPQFLPQGTNQGQSIKFFPTGQPIVPPIFHSNLPAHFLHSNPVQGGPLFSQQQFSMNNQAPLRNAPYYCTYIQAPNIPQQPAFPPMPTTSSFQNSFLSRYSDDKSKSKENVISEKQVNTRTTVKSIYDDSNEKVSLEVCNGFICSAPYRKCIPYNQRCDGKVDCLGAEDEIGCPIQEDTYYSRFLVDKQYENRLINVEDMTKTITTYIATTMMNPIIDTVTDRNDIETTTPKMIVPELPKHFKCKRIIQTVSMDRHCDGVFDCEDASDEEGCTCKDYLMLQRPTSVCDGHVDCNDGTDEEDCSFCRDDEYHCHRSGGCIPRAKFCNQAYDCKLNEDELDCFVLTDGKRVNLDLDKRPHLNLAGVLTRYERGAWRPSCFKSEYRSEAKRANAAQRVCEYLGFRSLDTVNEVIVQKSKLEERSSTKNFPITYEYPPAFTPMSKGDNNTCYGLYIRCKPILDSKVNVHLKRNPETDERSYLWPWEGSVFVDGKYQCPAVLLENDLLLASSKCAEDIDLRKNYTTAVFGVACPDMPYSGPYQQISQIVDVKPIKNSDASLFRLKNDINMTRYVQPIYLEKRIFPASTNDSCVALGVTDRGQRKMKFLQALVDNCPKCHRCYTDYNDVSCSKINETVNWSGNIVCLSGNGGWYPTAVFQDMDENCGFNNKQTLNSIDYIHAHLSEAIDEQNSNTVEMECNGIRCAFGQCIPWNHVCDGIRDCRDGADEDHNTCSEYSRKCEDNIFECKCTQAELRCGNGKCVSKEKFCDSKIDCADGSDEPATCTCAEYLKLTRPKLVCDNRRHCLDKSDEDYRHCYCKDNSFKCEKSAYNGTVACVSPDVVCDGHSDCPQGEDETEHACTTIKSARFEPNGRGELQRRSYGVWQSLCLPEPTKSQTEAQAACRKIGYSTGLVVSNSQTADSVYVPRNDFYMFQLNNHTWITMREDVSFGFWKRKVPWMAILTSVPIWSLMIVHCGNNWGFYTMLTEMPTYMKSILGFDVQRSGAISALPYLAMWILGFPISWLSDFALKKGATVQHVRKISNTIGLWVPALAMTILCLIKTHDRELLILVLVMAVGFNSGTSSGFQINHIDLSPDFAGTLMSITNSVANLFGILAPLTCGVIVTDSTNVKQWHTIFYISALIYFLSNLNFIIFGKAEIQPWSQPEVSSNSTPRRPNRVSRVSSIYDPTSVAVVEDLEEVQITINSRLSN
ncbi:uncharacterized protein LOC131673478 [Phymastichus coffea]|uniref:uncharacterized protein LOC131673478 n=1 Tax=Phymastichus coffea TaxID=108790 RepID=UPI00273AC1CE|nr:uncharacterized protein LOC131673478 [Phymastichus coffea]